MNFLLIIEALAQILPAVSSLAHTIEQNFQDHSDAQKFDHVMNIAQAAVCVAQVGAVTYEQLKPALQASVQTIVQANSAAAAATAPVVVPAPAATLSAAAPAEVAPAAPGTFQAAVDQVAGTASA